MPQGNIQAFVVQDLDHWSDSLLAKLWCWNTSKGAIAEEECAIIAFCSACCQCVVVGKEQEDLQLRSFSNCERSDTN
jgi:hypothetical protein